MKKLLLGLCLFGVLYFVGCMVVGGIAGGLAGSHEKSTAAAQQAGQFAGAQAVTEYRGFIAAGAAVMAVVLSNAALLMGMRKCSAE